MPLSLVYNRQSQVVADTSQVASAGTFTSAQFSTSGAARVTGTLFADQAGNLFVDQSSDGTNYDFSTAAQATVANGSGNQFSVEVVAPYARVRWTNTGASATTIKRLYAFTRSV